MADVAPLVSEDGSSKTAQTSDLARVGMVLATISGSSRCELAFISHRRGGARNRADRTSRLLSEKQIGALLEAASFAEATGRHFQRHWTVHYAAAGVAEEQAAAFITRLLNLVSKQARRAGGELTALWVRENGEGKGGHVHILLSLPSGMSLRNRSLGWIAAAGGKPARGVSKMRSIGGRIAVDTASDHFEANRDTVLRYLLKAADTEAAAAYSLDRYGEGGAITGKRCGWTQNIGKRARQRTARAQL